MVESQAPTSSKSPHVQHDRAMLVSHRGKTWHLVRNLQQGHWKTSSRTTKDVHPVERFPDQTVCPNRSWLSSGLKMVLSLQRYL